MILPVFIQAPWVHIFPLSALLFTFVLLITGLLLIEFFADRFINVGSLLIGVSGSWFGGCLFWGWLRAYPVWHLPVEAIALPIALVGLNTRWRMGSGFYLASLLGTAITDFMIVCTGVMKSWPNVVNANFKNASKLLGQTAHDLLHFDKIILLLLASALILYIAYLMDKRSMLGSDFEKTWIVSSSALVTTLWVDGLFLITTLIQPQLSGLI
ncbi:DUF3120 domain-containing protein [Prochlorococcus sp. MIT 1223]|uniref:DUF3120 domain-containing protein n=1 Tax=Prochlorococcus sp. MIT 1223 TaxID=3096217 RepID=UPI002A752DEF|nr:DUF3120 domain-containing protein [Prochlorococcus sp. MIT 1223]